MAQQLSEKGNLSTERTVARRLSVSVAAVRRWRLEGRGPRFIKVGGFLVRYRPEDLEAWIDFLPAGGQAPSAQLGAKR